MSRRPFTVLLLLLLAAIAVGLFALGAFPPAVTPEPVERVLPNERFQSSR
jgi:hypothetical protein